MMKVTTFTSKPQDELQTLVAAATNASPSRTNVRKGISDVGGGSQGVAGPTPRAWKTLLRRRAGRTCEVTRQDIAEVCQVSPMGFLEGRLQMLNRGVGAIWDAVLRQAQSADILLSSVKKSVEVAQESKQRVAVVEHDCRTRSYHRR